MIKIEQDTTNTEEPVTKNKRVGLKKKRIRNMLTRKNEGKTTDEK